MTTQTPKPTATKPKSPTLSSASTKTATTPTSAKAATSKSASASASKTSSTSEGLDIPPMKLKELIEAVVERTGQRKGEARTAVQAALTVMGETLGKGQEVNLPGLGKIKINRTKPTPRGKMMMIKLVQNKKSETPKVATTGSTTSTATKL